MSSTNFVNGTVVLPAWLNDVNNAVYNGKHFDSVNMINVKDPAYGAVGNEVADDTTAINSAIAAASARTYGGTVYFPSGSYITSSTITVPANVSLLGEAPGWYNGITSNTGVLICPKHTSDAVVFNSTNNGSGQYVDNIGIRGYGTLYVGGRGFVVGPCANITFTRCNVFHVNVDSFVFGDGSASANTIYAFNCYSNNPQTGSNFIVNSTLFRGDSLKSDGGVYGIDILAASTDSSIGRCHFEGWHTSGIRCASHAITWYGHNVLACTFANTLTFVQHTGSVNTVTYSGFDLQVGSVGAGSVGFDTLNASTITIRDSQVAKCSIGIYDRGTGDTIVDNVSFNSCAVGFSANSTGSKLTNCKFITSVTADVDHVSGSSGIWEKNTMSLTGNAAFRATNTGQAGNFAGNAVRNNPGFPSRTKGFATSVATTNTISHGLAVTPTANGAAFNITPATTGITSPISVDTLTSTTFRIVYTGTTGNFYWEASLLCDF